MFLFSEKVVSVKLRCRSGRSASRTNGRRKSGLRYGEARTSSRTSIKLGSPLAEPATEFVGPVPDENAGHLVHKLGKFQDGDSNT